MSELLRKELEAWLETDAGKFCADEDFLYLSSYKEILIARLSAAFEAGRQSAPEKYLPAEPTIEIIAALGFSGDVALAMGHADAAHDVGLTYKAMLAALPNRANEWLPIETHPRPTDNKRAFLVYRPDNRCAYMAYWDFHKGLLCWWHDGYGIDVELSLWMPLPTPPIEGK